MTNSQANVPCFVAALSPVIHDRSALEHRCITSSLRRNGSPIAYGKADARVTGRAEFDGKADNRFEKRTLNRARPKILGAGRRLSTIRVRGRSLLQPNTVWRRLGGQYQSSCRSVVRPIFFSGDWPLWLLPR
jgi:hypothetical protein